ncbi:hypothetical protein O3M35_001499 [Rhynocoris fuscipes]|uniref:RRM domain-containing protein n=1 Tax=Rhynocoris fuscipes TaxID=488301 RepID=A0AAW1CNP5_9HEMI
MAEISFDPPNSRLFILCSKTITENELHDAFDKYGQIEDIWIVKDKNTNESKGVVYIKYSKSSEAALAMEEMNGKTIGSLTKPIKVMMAHSREQGSRKDDDPERLQRLFIIVPKSATEEELHNHFKQFGSIDYISIVKNRETGESKGVAYVKYHRAYHAAKAYEECSRNYKAVFARPREPKPPTTFDGLPDRYSAPSYNDNLGGGRWSGGGGGGSSQDTRLLVTAPASLREEHLHRLFDIAPGLMSIRPFMQANSQYYGMQKLLVEYSCPNAASHALEKIDGLEYPPGHRISVKPYMASPYMMGRHDDMRGSSRHGNSSGLLGTGPKSDHNGMGGSNTTTISTSELATLTTALAKAEAIIKSAGLASGGIKVPSVPDGDTFDPSYCSVKLPPPQPLAPPTDDATHRLFIVSQPGLPPMYALRDVFGRFGNLVEVYTLHGKNCGYVTYATKESADEAIKTLHLQEVCGMRMKVMVAEPPRTGGANDRKRLRMDVEDSS